MVSLAPPLGCRPPPYRVPYTPHAKCWGASHRPHTCFTMEPLDDAHYIGLTLALARATAPPIHSHFLVAATVVYVDREGAVRHTHGVNAETCVLSSCICAERSALVQLRLSPTGWRYVRAVYITASCEALITPGLLCREFMSEMSEAACAVREAHGAQGPGAGGGGARTCAPDGDINIVLCNAAGAVARHALLELYPHPPPYHGVPNARLEATGLAAAQRAAAPSASALEGLLGGALAAAAAALCLQATALAAQPHELDDLYPVHLAAGVLFEDGSHALARQLKALEYGCSADAVVRLSGGLARRRPAALLVQSDQFGNLLAPSAPARALLAEHSERLGVASARVLLHSRAGELLAVPLSALAPSAPEIKTGQGAQGAALGAP